MTVCTGENCPHKQECSRYTNIVYGKKDFFASVPYQKNEGICLYFITNYPYIQQLAYYLWLEEGKPQGRALIHWQQAKKQIRKDKK